MNQDFAIGLHVMGFLASRDGELVSSNIMAESFGTSAVVLRRVLARLNHANLVETKRGANGGSKLARDAKTINLKEVYESVCQNPELFTRHPEGTKAISSILGGYINTLYKEAEKSMLSQLESTSISDMDSVVRPKIISALNCK